MGYGVGQDHWAVYVCVEGFLQNASIVLGHARHLADTCIVDEDIESAKFGFNLLRGASDGGVACYVKLYDTECACGLLGLDFFPSLLALFDGSRADDDVVVCGGGG